MRHSFRGLDLARGPNLRKVYNDPNEPVGREHPHSIRRYPNLAPPLAFERTHSHHRQYPLAHHKQAYSSKMGAVASCLSSVVSSIASLFHTIFSAIGSVLHTIVSAISSALIATFNCIADVLCCRCGGGRRRRTKV